MKLRTLELAERIDREHRAQIIRLSRAALLDPHDGRRPVDPQHRIKVRSVAEYGLHASVMLTFDRGAHASGWWRNSQYETCWHLSLVGVTRDARRDYAALPREEIAAWALAIFGEDAAKAWNEPPAGEHDPHRTAESSRYTWHTRVFVDQQGRPIVPEGEVYTLIPFDDGSSPDKIFRS